MFIFRPDLCFPIYTCLPNYRLRRIVKVIDHIEIVKKNIYIKSTTRNNESRSVL